MRRLLPPAFVHFLGVHSLGAGCVAGHIPPTFIGRTRSPSHHFFELM
jgi:hypothetical protein